MLRKVKTLDVNNIYNIIDTVKRMDESLVLDNRSYKQGDTIPHWSEYEHHSFYLSHTSNFVCDDWYQYHNGGKIIGEGTTRIYDLHLNGVVIHLDTAGYIRELFGSNVLDNQTFITNVVMWGRKKKQ